MQQIWTVILWSYVVDKGKETDSPEYLENLKKLGIYSRKEDDYKLWAISWAEEIRQENIDRAKLKKTFYDELEKSMAKGKGKMLYYSPFSFLLWIS